MIFIGVDPGKDGAFAQIWDSGRTTVHPWSREEFIAELWSIRNAELEAIACVEKVGAMPKQGVSSTFTFGKSAGFIEGALEMAGIPYQLITPQRWKKEFGLNSDKAKSIEVCRQLFPAVDLRRTTRCKKDHDGLAESLLMALYAKRRL